MKSLYDLIGARPDDDTESLKKAYRNAVKANHPDLHADDPEAVTRIALITAAYDILRDPEQRAAYDRTLETRREPAQTTVSEPAPSRMRSLISSMTAGAAVTLMLSAGFLLLARVSGISIADVVGRKAPQENETPAVQLARPAMSEAPFMIPNPSVVTSPADDRAASEEMKDNAASPETRGRVASEETTDRTASQERKNTAVSEETKNGTASEESKTLAHPVRPSIDVASHNIDLDGRINWFPPEKHSVIEYDAPLVGTCKRWEVAATDKDGSTILKCGGNIAHFINGNMTKIVSKSGNTIVEFKPHSFNLSFPLEAGKKWTGKYTLYSASNRILSGAKGCTVNPPETVKVLAGKFDAYRIDCVDTVRSTLYSLGKTHSSVWYAPKIATIVKYVNSEAPELNFQVTSITVK